MRFRIGEPYRGPGAPDPKKTRHERQAELVSLLRSATGRDVVMYHFLLYTGGLSGLVPPIGARMLETILDREYPNG